MRGRDAKRRAAARQLLQPPRVAQRALDRRVAVGGLMVKEHQVLDVRALAKLDAYHVARMAPVFLDRVGLGERIHGAEDRQIGVAEESDDRLSLGAVLELVL